MRKKLKATLCWMLAISMMINTGFVANADETTVDITDGLIAYYDFENVDGTNVPNTVDDTYTGTLVGGISTEQNDTWGTSLKFEGDASKYMSIPQIVNTGEKSYSVSLWYKLDTSYDRGIKNTVLVTQTGSGRILINLKSNNTYHTYINAQDVVSDGTAAVNDWQHVTYVYDSDAKEVSFYINGVLDCTKAAGAGEVNALTDLIIGRHKNGGNDPLAMKGLVDELRVYEKEVTADEAAAIYAYTTPVEEEKVDITTGMIAYYDFEGVSGTSVTNKVDAENYAGTINGNNVTVEENDFLGDSLKFAAGSGDFQITGVVNTGTSSYSVSMWYKYTGGTSRNDHVYLLQQTGSGRSLLFLTPENKYGTYVNAENKYSEDTVQVGGWQHVTYTYDSDTNKVKFYVNGELSGERDTNGNSEVNALTDLLIGRHKNGSTTMLGYVDEVRVYGKVVTDGEANAIYKDKAAPIVYADLQTVITAAQAVSDSGRLEETNAAAAALAAELTAAKALTKNSSYEEIVAAIAELEAAVDAYNDAVGVILTLNLNEVERIMEPSTIGINHRYGFNGYGTFDTDTWKVDEDFAALYKEAGFGSLRYPGGTISNLYRWKTSIGPVENRVKQIHGFYNNSGQHGLAPNFGLTEVGDFAEEMGSELVYVYGFGRGSAQDAADLIEYLNAPVGLNPNGGIDWAAVREENGHPEPYGVRYFEIGNENNQAFGQGSDGTASQGYWLDYAGGAEYAYVHGGTATCNNQYAVLEDDWNVSGSYSTGKAGQKFYMRYANPNPMAYDADGNIVLDDKFVAVNKGSVHVYVGSTEWTIVDSFDGAAANAQVVVVDYRDGSFTFGNGVNGAIPASGQQIKVTYSVDREGFADVAGAMKEVTAEINAYYEEEGIDKQEECYAYSSYETQGFIDKMAAAGYNDLYDGFTIHPYSGTPSGGSPETFYDSAMNLAESAGIGKVQKFVDMLPEGKVPVISEYGIFRSTDLQVRSQTHALYIARVLMEYVRLGSPYIQKHCLVDWYSSGADSLGPTQQAVIQAVPQAGASTQTGEGNFEYFATPSAKVFEMLKDFGTNVVSSEFSYMEEHATGYELYSALATTNDEGDIYVAIVNLDKDNAKRMEIDGIDATGKKVTMLSLTGDSITAQNTPENPDNVDVVTTVLTESSTTESVSVNIPAHTFVVLKIETSHEWSDWTVTKEATCTEVGTETRTCADCDEVQTREIEATGHAYGDWTVTKEATCTEVGTETRTCANDEAHKETKDIAAKGHTEVTVAGKDATCTEEGLTEGKKCSVCDTVTKEQETIPAKGHTFGEWTVVKEATEEETGLKERVCACGEKETEVIPKLEPTTPEDPVDPEQPEDPKDPVDPEKPETDDKEEDKSPVTGDAAMIVPMVVFMAACAAIVAAILRRRFVK